MTSRAVCLRRGGFTLIEMMVTLAIVGLLALTSTPLIELTARRHKEADLREALRVIRTGLDAYKTAVDTGVLPKVAGASGYPPTLDTLTESLQRADSSDATSTNAGSRIIILRRLPRDPFVADALVPAAQTWNTRSYGSRSDDPQPGDDVFDVSSRSTQTALDGSVYASW